MTLYIDPRHEGHEELLKDLPKKNFMIDAWLRRAPPELLCVAPQIPLRSSSWGIVLRVGKSGSNGFENVVFEGDMVRNQVSAVDLFHRWLLPDCVTLCSESNAKIVYASLPSYGFGSCDDRLLLAECSKGGIFRKTICPVPPCFVEALEQDWFRRQLPNEIQNAGIPLTLVHLSSVDNRLAFMYCWWL